LVVLYYAINGGPNGLDLYRWGTDCKAPTLVGHYDFGGHAPHEFYVWQDPKTPARVLAFVTMFASAGNSLNVIDVSDPTKPALLAGWSAPSSYGYAPLHSIALSPDGRTAYLSLWTGGLVVADASDFTSGAGQLTLRLLTPAAARFRTPPGNVHSAVPVPGQSLLITTDERYPSPYGQGCPYGNAHLVDVSNPAKPTVVSTMAIPENDPAACAAAGSGTWTSHNPTLTAHLALVTWYSGGIQVFGLDDVAHPTRLAEIRPAGTSPTLRDVQLGTTAAMTWSYPVIAAGLIYVVDINQGLLVLRYQGPHQDEVSTTAFAEGNSNLVASRAQSAATPSSAPTATVAPSSQPTPGAATSQQSSGALPWLIGGGVFVLALGLRVAGGVRRRETAKNDRDGARRLMSNPQDSLGPPSGLTLGLALEPLGVLLEGRSQVRDRAPDHGQHRAAVLLAHVEPGGAALGREGVGPDALEEAQWHAPRPHHLLPRLELRDLDREGLARVDLDVDLDRLSRLDLALNLLNPRVPVGEVGSVGDDSPDGVGSGFDHRGRFEKLHLS